MDRRDGYHPDHPITGRQVKLLRLAVGVLLTVDRPLAALFASDPNPPTREEYARLYALLIRVTEQGGTFDLERVCGCCVDNECECDGTALRPAAYGGQLTALPRPGGNFSAGRPMPLTAIKATVREGTVWQMTNHRHTIDGHTPAPPGLVRVVHVTASGSSFHLASAGSQDGRDVPGGPAIIQWPVAARVGYDPGTGTIRLYGPAGDRSDPWLTLVPGRPGAALPDDRGFYRHVIQLEILSRGRVNPGDLDGLADVGYEITEGQRSGNMTTVAVNEQVSTDRMAELLQAQGSDADFLLPAGADDDLCECRAPASSCTFPHLCLACGYRLPGTIGNCPYCAGEIALNPDGLWAIAGTDAEVACEEAPDRYHHPVLLLSAGTGEDGTCNCQEPGPGELDERTCRNCGYPLSGAQLRELARFPSRSIEPDG